MSFAAGRDRSEAERADDAAETMTQEPVQPADEALYKALLSDIPNAVCVSRVLYDKRGRPSDFVFVTVNEAPSSTPRSSMPCSPSVGRSASPWTRTTETATDAPIRPGEPAPGTGYQLLIHFCR